MHDGPTRRCELCDRLVPLSLITQHHLTPRQKGGKAVHRVPMCRPCHKQVHAVFTNTELARQYASIAHLRESPQLQAFLQWIRRQKPDRNFRIVQSERRRQRSRWVR